MPRSIWSGAISFGLVNVPVRLVTATREHAIHFHMLTKDGTCRVRRKLVCPETGDEVDYKNTARGFEVAPDQYVLVSDEELSAVKPEARRTIEINEFVDLKAIDPIWYDAHYYLLPDESGAKAYRLLLDAMTAQHRVAVGHFVMRQKEHLVTIRPVGGVLMLHTMRYADEVLMQKDLEGLPREASAPKREMEVAQKLIDALTVKKFDPSKYHDDYRKKLEAMIRAKAEGERVVTAAAEPEAPRVINLMEALRKSLDEAQHPGEPPGRRAEPRRRRTASHPAPRRRKKTA